jgi:hypothetical protein
MPSLRRRLAIDRAAHPILAIALGLALAGCGAGPGASPSEVAPPSGAPSSESALPSVGPAPTPDDAGVTGLLVAPADAETVGGLGTWVLDGRGSDSPWLPWRAGAAVPVPPGVPVTIRLADGSPIGWWFVDLADEKDVAGLRAIRLGGREVDLPPLDSVQLEPLPAGRWVLAARLFRADGRGEGVTYWSLLVSP